MRVGYGAINDNGLARGVRAFSGDDREAFFDWLYGDEANGGTPLRKALERAGEYFEYEQPWRTDPTDSDSELLTCRQSYTVLMTDGYYDSGERVDADNADGTAGETITGPGGQSFRYTPSNPFSDDRRDTLADVAMYFWKRDLRDDIDNEVPTTDSNPAFWQHMVTFGVGLGVEGTVSSEDAFSAITDPDVDIDWPSPYDSRPGKIDDLLHAGVNSRGGFFNASDPQQFAKSLSQILSEVIARANATTSVAVSSTRLDAGAFVYRAMFDSEDWSGELIADNVLEGDTFYASEEIEDQGDSGRNIYTFIPSNSEGVADGVGDGDGAEFTSNLSEEIGGRFDLDEGDELWTFANVVNYLRGDDELEGEGGFRPRNSLLGDVVNSRPVASTAGNDGWGRVDNAYLGYVAGKKNDPRDCPESGDCPYERKDTVFVGANDGMLHAFDGRTLEEYFAYVPAALHHKLKHLADKDYTHRYYVDGQVAVGDANIEGSWGTYLVGTLGGGGRGVYALDVTDPEDFTEDDVLWELTAEDDPDIGYTYGEPVITRLQNGTWVAIFGNGYNSQDRQAYLFVVDLRNGEVLQKVAVGDAGSNGLSGVASWTDPVERAHVARVYAGDLEGTMWRFDFEDGSASSAFDDGLFHAGRPIMSRPSLGANPGGGLMVYFGTGKLVEKSDKTDVSDERFYAIRDRNQAVDFAQLAAAGSGGGVGGWYEDLGVDGRTGEKAFGPPTLEFGRLFYSTFEPVNDACSPGGKQWTYRREPFGGGGEPPTLIGTGAPISPPITVRPPGPPEGDVPFPGDPDPDDGGDHPEFPEPPEPTGGDPESWCSVIEIPPLVEGGPWVELGTVCEGRQVWREVD
jgi:type IV pilus assembly protein PilY1